MLKTFQSKLRKKNILWLFAGLPEREIVQEGWMSASMGPDYYQVPDMFTVASIQVLMMYYFHCKNSIDGGHDEDEYWPRDPYIQWKQTHLFLCLLILDIPNLIQAVQRVWSNTLSLPSCTSVSSCSFREFEAAYFSLERLNMDEIEVSKYVHMSVDHQMNSLQAAIGCPKPCQYRLPTQRISKLPICVGQQFHLILNYQSPFKSLLNSGI